LLATVLIAVARAAIGRAHDVAVVEGGDSAAVESKSVTESIVALGFATTDVGGRAFVGRDAITAANRSHYAAIVGRFDEATVLAQPEAKILVALLLTEVGIDGHIDAHACIWHLIIRRGSLVRHPDVVCHVAYGHIGQVGTARIGDADLRGEKHAARICADLLGSTVGVDFTFVVAAAGESQRER